MWDQALAITAFAIPVYHSRRVCSWRKARTARENFKLVSPDLYEPSKLEKFSQPKEERRKQLYDDGKEAKVLDRLMYLETLMGDGIRDDVGLGGSDIQK